MGVFTVLYDSVSEQEDEELRLKYRFAIEADLGLCIVFRFYLDMFLLFLLLKFTVPKNDGIQDETLNKKVPIILYTQNQQLFAPMCQ